MLCGYVSPRPLPRSQLLSQLPRPLGISRWSRAQTGHHGTGDGTWEPAGPHVHFHLGFWTPCPLPVTLAPFRDKAFILENKMLSIWTVGVCVLLAQSRHLTVSWWEVEGFTLLESKIMNQ